MRTLSGALTAALADGHVVIAQLLKLDFPSGTIALNSSTHPIVYGGTTYQAAAGLGQISPIVDRGGELPGLRLELARVDSSYIALALDDADEVQGAAVTLRTAIIDKSTYQLLDALPADFTGYGDVMAISEDGQTCSISMTVESKGVDLLRGNPSVYGDGDQQALYPGDRAFEYVVSDADKPVVWPTREHSRR